LFRAAYHHYQEMETAWWLVRFALVSVRSAADERFFGAPFWALQNTRPLEQMLIELIAILMVAIGLFALRQTKPVG
jgi:hypothetical protein